MGDTDEKEEKAKIICRRNMGNTDEKGENIKIV